MTRKKKRNPKLIPVKKPVFDTRLGKTIERTYYINPENTQKKDRENLQKLKEEFKQRQRLIEEVKSQDFKDFFKVAICRF